MACYRVEAGAILLAVRLTPGASRDAVGGVVLRDDGREFVQVHVRARPEAGAANEALVAVLAKTLRIARSRIEIIGGATARQKLLRITGDAEALGALVAAWKGGS